MRSTTSSIRKRSCAAPECKSLFRQSEKSGQVLVVQELFLYHQVQI